MKLESFNPERYMVLERVDGNELRFIPFRHTVPKTQDDILDEAIKEYIWRFINKVDPNKESFTSMALFDQYSSINNALETVIKAVKGCFVIITGLLLADNTSGYIGLEKNEDGSIANIPEGILKAKTYFKDRAVIEDLSIESTEMGVKGKVTVKYFKEVNDNIVYTPFIISASFDITDIFSKEYNIALSKAGNIRYFIDAGIRINPDIKCDTSDEEVYRLAFRNSLDSIENFKRVLAQVISTSKENTCNICSRCSSSDVCTICNGSSDMPKEKYNEILHKNLTIFKEIESPEYRCTMAFNANDIYPLFSKKFGYTRSSETLIELELAEEDNINE